MQLVYSTAPVNWTSSPEALRNVDYPFSAITSRSTLTQNGSTIWVLSMGQIKYLIIYYTSKHLTVCKQMTDVKLKCLVLDSKTWKYLTVQMKLLMFDCNSWNHLTVCKQMNSAYLKTVYYKTIHFQIIYI